ncbi:hypothetical protein C0995_016039 [Termitomyces sp. Mi166|nr:hypothetical protein C0995_016039 [Termitomyces sp. Mi166\
MPADHELQLMLVNTLRKTTAQIHPSQSELKDLEHNDIPRICLALENVISSSNQDLVPAIQTRLYDLLSHHSSHVRRRALLAYRSLDLSHVDLLSNIGRKVVSRCKDPDQQVVGAALSLCVQCTDPVLWAGTSNDIPAVLDGWEVERIMQFLDLSDVLVRKTTLRLLHRVDPSIASIYYSQAVQNIPSGLSVTDLNERALRFLEVITVQSGEDGELYARELKDILLGLEQASFDGQPVLEAIVDEVLTYTRHDCDEVPSSVITIIAELGHHSKRHLRQLPDFLTALSVPSKQSPTPTTLSSSQVLSASKLRYDAYDAPTPAPKLRNRDVSLSPHLIGNTQWDRSSDTALSRVSSALSGSSPDPQPKPLTAGEPALAASRRELDVTEKAGSDRVQASRVDLISLDSPFVSESTRSEGRSEEDFESLWDSMEDGDARGWFNGSVGVAVERMRSLRPVRLKLVPVDLPPYLGAGSGVRCQDPTLIWTAGDLKVIVGGAGAQAALRLRESDDDSCLWRLRCSDSELHGEVKRYLE